jgi:hypothetical protein
LQSAKQQTQQKLDWILQVGTFESSKVHGVDSYAHMLYVDAAGLICSPCQVYLMLIMAGAVDYDCSISSITVTDASQPYVPTDVTSGALTPPPPGTLVDFGHLSEEQVGQRSSG